MKLDVPVVGPCHYVSSGWAKQENRLACQCNKGEVSSSEAAELLYKQVIALIKELEAK